MNKLNLEQAALMALALDEELGSIEAQIKILCDRKKEAEIDLDDTMDRVREIIYSHDLRGKVIQTEKFTIATSKDHESLTIVPAFSIDPSKYE